MLRIDDTGDKPTAQAANTTGKARTSADTTADIRDIVNAFIGKGGVGMKDESSRNDYARLRALLGDAKAQKLMESVFIHNQRNAAVPMEKRIQTFYDVGSNDAGVNELIAGMKNLGYGPLVGGFRESSKRTNQILTGRIPADIATTASDNSDLQQKIMLRLNK